jgi:hypothetical protein
LGTPFEGGNRPAYFQTAGGRLYLTAHTDNHGGIFDPDRGSSL